jgi:Domain of unknown function (DUF4440)
MWGAIKLANPASILPSVRPAIRWCGLAVVVGGALIAVFILPRAQPKVRPVAFDEAPVLAADNALAEALRAGDRKAARRLLTLQFTSLDADGMIHPRHELLGALKALAPQPATDLKIRNSGLLAMMTGHRPAAHGADVFFLDIWVKQKGAWRALLMQDVPIGPDEQPTATAAALHVAELKASECTNPCKTLPYRVRSAAEQDVVSAYQAIAKAAVAHDASEWARHVTDDFIAYAGDRPQVTRTTRIAALADQSDNVPVMRVGEVQTMRLAVYGDGAVMITTEADGSKAYRGARVFVRRDGRWLMAISAQTDVKSQ